MNPSIKHLPNNPTLMGQAEVLAPLQYSENGQTLTMIRPWAVGQLPDLAQRRPVIVFVQGSAWTSPNMNFEIPMLSDYAEAGYIAVTVSHRSYKDGHRMPAFLEDVKCAIRFLRANADEYQIDPERIMIYGTSSGGNTALLVGLTADDSVYKSGEYADYSDKVSAVVECFGPTDLLELFSPLMDQPETQALLSCALGEDSMLWEAQLTALSPALRTVPERVDIPFLLLHGSADPIVPIAQMEKMYAVLNQLGADVEAYCVDQAVHEHNFWGPELRKVVKQWITQKLPL